MAPETPKGVSSRLLTMKFMQRAAASTSPATPESVTHSSKKRKIDQSNSEGKLSMSMDQAAIQAAINEQQATRQAALDRHVTGDTHWVLNTSLGDAKSVESASAPLKIKYIGYGDIDSGDESGEQEDEAQMGRTSTNNYKQAQSKKQKIDGPTPNGEEGSDSKSDDSNDSDPEAPLPSRSKSSRDSQTSTRNNSRSRSRSIQRSESIKAKELREKRKKKDVPLSRLTSISSGGNKNFSPASAKTGSKGGRKM